MAMAMAQAPAASDAPAPPPPKYDGWVFSGYADGYFTHNFNSPASNFNELQNFNLKSDQPNLNLAKFTIDKSDKMFGIHTDVGLGEAMRFIHSGDPAAIDHKGLRYIEQAYLIYKPANAHGLEVDFGQFVTSAGAEVIETNANWNYSRSLLFAWNIPYYHFGFRANLPVTKELTVGFQLVNAWNTVWGNNNLNNVGLTLAYTKPKFTYNLNYYEGPNHPGTTRGKRNLIDSTLLINATPKFSFYINGDYARDNRIDGGNDPFYGIAGAGRYQLTSKFAVAARTEVFNDVTGFSTGTKQVVREGTVTGEYKYNDHFIARAELRRDASNSSFFEKGSSSYGVKGATTFTVGLMAVLGPWK